MSDVVAEDVRASVEAAETAQAVVGLLGPVAIRHDGVLEPVPGRRLRTVLAALAMEPGRHRSASSLIDEVWGDALPRDPMNALHTQLSRIRALLPDGALEQGPAGYRLVLPRGSVDLSTAQDAAAGAEELIRTGSPEAALDLLESASGLVRGIAGDDLPPGAVRDGLRADTMRLRSRFEAARVDAAIAAGRDAEVLPLLREICERVPLDEPSHAKLMRVLAATGRGNEAVELYAAVRARLADRLGTDPSAELSSVHLAILRGELGPRLDERGDERPDGAGAGAGTTGAGLIDAVGGSVSGTGGPAAVPRSIGVRAEPNTLIGRDEDIGNVRGLLETARVVTVLGTGGTGKTRLANHLGSAMAADRRVAMVELVGVRTGEDVAAAVAGILGLGDADRRVDLLLPDAAPRAVAAERADARTRLRSALGASPTLLILDNCEQVVDACADLVADLTASCPDLTVLATSRTPLMIGAESTYPLSPLPVAGAASPAAELFTQRARAVRPSVRLDPAAVEQLCTTLDGLPLAIELAAARVRTMSVEEINERLTDRFALLHSSDRSAPRRHRTLHAVIEWSWNLLGDRERAAMRALCSLPGGFTMDAARCIVGGGAGRGNDGAGAADLSVDTAVEGLVDQSLLEVTEYERPVGMRYHMLETVREFGLQRRDQEPRVRAEADRRFRAWAADFSTRVARNVVGGTDAADAMVEVEADQENLVVVLRSALDEGETAVVLPVFDALAVYWSVRGSHPEAGVWAWRVHQHLDDVEGGDGPGGWAYDPALDVDVLHTALLLIIAYQFFLQDRRSLARTRIRIRALMRGRPAVAPELDFLERLVTAPTDLRRGRIFAQGARSGDAGVRTLAHSLRANAHENAGRRVQAYRDAVFALDLARQRGDRWTEGMNAQMLGQLANQMGRYEEAVGYLRQSARILWDVHAYEESIQIRGFIASALVGAGQPEAGRREALAARAAGERMVPSGGTSSTAQYHSAIAAALAEAELAEGRVDSGLQLYWEGVEEGLGVHGNEEAAGIDPYVSMLLAAAVCAHVDGGSLARARWLAGTLARAVVPRISVGAAGGGRTFIDLPVAGAVLMALVSVGLSVPGITKPAAQIPAGEPAADTGPTGPPRDPARRLAWELALAGRINARQDYPSMRYARWSAAARLVLGDEAVDAEAARVARLSREDTVLELGRALERDRPALQ